MSETRYIHGHSQGEQARLEEQAGSWRDSLIPGQAPGRLGLAADVRAGVAAGRARPEHTAASLTQIVFRASALL